MKTDEYMKSELSNIFQVKRVLKHMVLLSSGTYFMHMRVQAKMQQSITYNCADFSITSKQELQNYTWFLFGF